MSYTNSFCVVCQGHVPVMLVLGPNEDTQEDKVQINHFNMESTLTVQGQARVTTSKSVQHYQIQLEQTIKIQSRNQYTVSQNYGVFSQGPQKPGFLSCFVSPRLELELHAETSLTMDFVLHLRFLSLAVRAKL